MIEMAEITGRQVFAFTAGAFGIIIAVNLLLAYKAISTFPGLEVANGYVASQDFDARKRAQLGLGWTLTHVYRPGHLVLDFADSNGLPAAVTDLDVLVGRATEAKDDFKPVFNRLSGVFVADVTLPRGKWIVVVNAKAADGTRFNQRLDLLVQE
jgi:nitrogen fixation protein FixH